MIFSILQKNTKKQFCILAMATLLSGCMSGTQTGTGFAGFNFGNIAQDVAAGANQYNQLKQTTQSATGNFTPLNLQVNPSKSVVVSPKKYYTVTLVSVAAAGAASNDNAPLSAVVTEHTSMGASTMENAPLCYITCVATTLSTNTTSTSPAHLINFQQAASSQEGYFTQDRSFSVSLGSMPLPVGFGQNDQIQCSLTSTPS